MWSASDDAKRGRKRDSRLARLPKRGASLRSESGGDDDAHKGHRRGSASASTSGGGAGSRRLDEVSPSPRGGGDCKLLQNRDRTGALNIGVQFGRLLQGQGPIRSLSLEEKALHRRWRHLR